ncbi:MAG: hypothetical protein AB8H86_08860 [Polyangiales bacterium]
MNWSQATLAHLSLLVCLGGCAGPRPAVLAPVTLPEPPSSERATSDIAREPILAGEQSFTLVLEAESEFAATDAENMVAHLVSFGAAARARDVGSRSITLDVSQALDAQAVLVALRPVNLRASLVLDITSVGQAAVELGTLPGRRVVGESLVGECSDLEVYNHTNVASCFLMLERAGSGEPCHLHCLSREVVLTSGDVREASVEQQDYGLAVTVVLTEEAARRFGDFSGAHVGQRLAIATDEEVLTAPVIRSRIDGGHIQISLGTGDTRPYAERLAAGLRPAAVRTPWRLLRIE